MRLWLNAGFGADSAESGERSRHTFQNKGISQVTDSSPTESSREKKFPPRNFGSVRKHSGDVTEKTFPAVPNNHVSLALACRRDVVTSRVTTEGPSIVIYPRKQKKKARAAANGAGGRGMPERRR